MYAEVANIADVPSNAILTTDSGLVLIAKIPVKREHVNVGISDCPGFCINNLICLSEYSLNSFIYVKKEKLSRKQVVKKVLFQTKNGFLYENLV
jgi:hypothetical protein